MTKFNLRGLHQKEMNLQKHENKGELYRHLINEVEELAKMGETKCKFTLMCSTGGDTSNCEWNKENGHKLWLERQSQYHFLKLLHLSVEEFTNDIIGMLKETFPDSNFTSVEEKCCNYHTISW